jgi:hypothetical protein
LCIALRDHRDSHLSEHEIKVDEGFSLPLDTKVLRRALERCNDQFGRSVRFCGMSVGTRYWQFSPVLSFKLANQRMDERETLSLAAPARRPRRASYLSD